METTTSKPNMAKKTRVTAGKTRVGRPTPAANEPMPIAAWVLPMTAILRKLENLAQAAHEVVDVGNGEDIYSSRIDRLIALHFMTSRQALEQGGRNSSESIEFLYDAQALILGAQAVDVSSPNREALHKLMLRTIDDVINTDRWEGLDDAELAQILAGLPSPDQVPLIMAGLSDQAIPIQPQPKQEAQEKSPFVTKQTLMSADSKFGQALMLDCTFDIEGAALQLIRRSRELDLQPEESAELRSIGARVKALNSALMSALSGDDVLTVGDVHQTLFHGAVEFPQGVAA